MGVGNMGAGMASNLAKAVSSLFVFDADAKKCSEMREGLQDPLRSVSMHCLRQVVCANVLCAEDDILVCDCCSQRVTVGKSLREVAERSDIVCLSLAKEEVCEEVIFGNSGIASVWSAGSQASGKVRLIE